MVNRLNNRVIQRCLLLLLVLASFWLTPAIASLTATVDRTAIAEYETFELTLRSDSDTRAAPDLSPLETDFDVLGTRQSRQVRIINGRSESWRDWTVTLSPKRAGQLVIPALTVGKDSSEAIAVHVVDTHNANAAGATDYANPVFIKTSLDNETVYVQQEVVLTLQIYHGVPLYDDKRLTPLEVNNSIVQQLGETEHYETVMNGTRYGVFELKFSIHPQKPGAITIPAMTFSGSIMENKRRLGGFLSGGGKPVTSRSPEIQLDVKPQPDSYQGAAWLPAKSLTLTDGWSGPTDTMKVGDAVTRTIAVNAEGLTSAQLPQIKMPKLSGINAYPDQSITDDKATETGITGVRIETIAIIPTQPGTLTLPPIYYRWFDTITNTEKLAQIPAKTIQVLPTENTASSEPEAPAVKAPERPVEDDRHNADSVNISHPNNQLTLWHGLTVLFATLWLMTTLTFWQYGRKKRALLSHSNPETQSIKPKTFNEPMAFKQLARACKNGDLNDTRQSMIQWVQALYQDKKPVTLDQCATKLASHDLNILIDQLNSALFSGREQNLLFDGEALLEQVRTVREKVTKDKKSGSKSVNGLYPV